VVAVIKVIMMLQWSEKDVAGSVMVKRIGSVVDLTEPVRNRIRKSAGRCERRAKGTLLTEQGDVGRKSCFLLSGWALRQVYLADGRRQIFGFVLPGDPLEPFGCLGSVSHEGILAVTSVDLVDIGRALGADLPRCSDELDQFEFLIAREQLGYIRNQIRRLGCQNAYQRVAHFLLELHDRLSAVGMVVDGSFALPLTQEMMGDALGLSVVHVSRMLKQLREADLIDIADGWVQLRRRGKLSALCEYVGIRAWRPAAVEGQPHLMGGMN
jgi:CRP-like cAMP-binding protein